MAVVRVNEIWEGRQGSEDDQGEREYTRVFRVITDNTLTASLSVRYAVGIPERFDPYQDADGTVDTQAFVKDIKETQTEDPYVWLVSVLYSSKLEQPDYGDEDPLARPAEVRWGTIKERVPAITDRDGEPILNSAFAMFDPPVEKDEYRDSLTITKNLASYDPDYYREFKGAVNSAAWLGFGVNEVKCTNITSTRKYEKGLEFQEVTFEFEGAAEATVLEPNEDPLIIAPWAPVTHRDWTTRVLDQGYYDVLGVTFLDLQGQPKTTPTRLDGNGLELDPTDPTTDTPAVFLEFDIPPEKDFNALPIP